MSTTSATIIRQTAYWGEEAPQSEELMRCYRHYTNRLGKPNALALG